MSNEPVEAIKGRLEHLRGIALGFRNLEHYIFRPLIQPEGLRGRISTLSATKSRCAHGKRYNPKGLMSHASQVYNLSQW